MATRTGKVIMAKDIGLDKGHTNVLDYSEANMVSLLTTNKVYEATNCSFVRQGENKLDLGVTYSQALQCDYLAFQNPDYNNKWFFAFIDDVEYRSDGMTRVTFTIDDFATWYDYWTPKACYVLREHTNNDTFGANTVPENLNTGEYILNGSVVNCDLNNISQSETNTMMICFQVSDFPDGNGALSPSLGDDVKGMLQGDVYSGLSYLIVFSAEHANRLIRCYDLADKHEAIVSIFMLPWGFYNDVGSVVVYTNATAGTIGIAELKKPTQEHPDVGRYATLIDTMTISRPTTINGYTPKNNKMLCWPFSYFYISNNSGTDVGYHWEDFSSAPSFNVDGVINQGCSIKAYPTNYKNGTDKDGYNYGINAGKIPICAWNSDYYINWQTQQAVNYPLSIGTSIANTGLGMIGSLATGNIAGLFGSALSGISQIAGAIGEDYKAKITPDQARGNANCADLNSAETRFGFTIYPMSIKAEYARICDDFLTRFGYQTNRIKIPNQTGRTYWNFVQIAGSEEIGYSNSTISVPPKAMENINNIYRAGVTIWHNHANLGNFSLTNTIVS